MKVTIATSGRFHLADLTREILRLGHAVEFHSISPPWKLQHFGIPRSLQKCHLSKVLLEIIALRVLKLSQLQRERVHNRVSHILDQDYAYLNKDTDIFMGMSGLCLKSLKAFSSCGVPTVLRRGSAHIIEQKRILDSLRSKNEESSISDWIIEREIKGYEIADKIAIPSRHVESSFIAHGIPQSKLFWNPYGVDIEGFTPIPCIKKRFDVITTGLWCKRKGSDLLASTVLEHLGRSLLHVGPVGDIPLPSHRLFHHHQPVAQHQLPRFYSSAKVFAMPSREDGFGVVYAQALACGLPIIGSITSGVPDIVELLGLQPPFAQVVSNLSEIELGEAIESALAAPPQPNIDFSPLTWKAFAVRTIKDLETLI